MISAPTFTERELEIAEANLREIYAYEIQEYNMLLAACRVGFAHMEVADDRYLVDHLESGYYALPFELKFPLEDDAAAIIEFDYRELRSFKMDLARYYVELVRQGDKSYGLTERDGPYQKLLRLVRESHEGFGLYGFHLEELGVSHEESSRWDLAECTVADSLIDYDQYDDDWGF